MNIAKRIDQYDNNCIFFCEPIKNNVMNEGKFIRILYSNNVFALNGIYLLITLNDVVCDFYYNKYKCSFNPLNHKEIISSLQAIEEEILTKANIKDKAPQFIIYEKLKSGNIKLFNDIGTKTTCSFILKISGIWETRDNYGLTYKFIKVN